jgi:hypothetical protein
MLRSALERTLRANGYSKGMLKQKIDDAAADGVITESRKRQAHDNVRLLGNEVVHDEWRAVDADEYSDAYKYTHRVIEDFYESRVQVLAQLKARQRPLPDDPEADAGAAISNE